MKYLHLFLCALVLFPLSPSESFGQAKKPKPARITVGRSAPADTQIFGSSGGLYQSYETSLSGALGGARLQDLSRNAGGIKFGAKLNAASIAVGQKLQYQNLQGVISTAGTGGLTDAGNDQTGRILAALAGLNSGSGQGLANVMQSVGSANVSVPSLLQSLALQPQALTLPQNGFVSPSPALYGYSLPSQTALIVPGAGTQCSPTPASYASLASQNVSVFAQGGITPAQYANPGISVSPTVSQYNLSTNQAATLIAYSQALLPVPSDRNGLGLPSGQVVDMSTVTSVLQNATGFQGVLSAIFQPGTLPIAFGSNQGSSSPIFQLGIQGIDVSTLAQSLPQQTQLGSQSPQPFGSGPSSIYMPDNPIFSPGLTKSLTLYPGSVLPQH